MANLIKIGHRFLNIDLIQNIDDQFAETREDKMVVRFGPGEGETLILKTSGVVDSKNGVYRIPVDRAIDLMAKKGLPEKPSAGVTTGAQ